MIKIAICDDDESYLIKIRDLIKQHKFSKFCEIQTFNNGANLLADNIKSCDIVFLDIEINDILGVDIAIEILKANRNAIIIYITSYSQYISKALIPGAFQYLLKPLDEDLFSSEFSRAVDQLRKIKSYFIFKVGAEKKRIKIGDICYFEFLNRKIYVNLINGDIIKINGSISTLSNNLMPYNFFRCHNSFLVNLTCISQIKRYELTLINNSNIPVSKRYYLQLKELLREYITGVSL